MLCHALTPDIRLCCLSEPLLERLFIPDSSLGPCMIYAIKCISADPMIRLLQSDNVCALHVSLQVATWLPPEYHEAVIMAYLPDGAGPKEQGEPCSSQ